VEPLVRETLGLAHVVGGVRLRLGKVSLIWVCILEVFAFFPEFHT
jgi:hypothetical protein